MAKCSKATASGIILVLPLVMVAQAMPLNCSTQFRAALHQVIELRKTCGEAVYRDCCEVSTHNICLLYTSPSPRDATLSRMPSSA